MYNEVIPKAEEYIRSLFKTHLNGDYSYHNFDHTHGVVKAALLIMEQEKTKPGDAALVLLAAWFHDAGITLSFDDHEAKGCMLAERFLRAHEVSEAHIGEIKDMIMATKLGSIPQKPLEKILKDADLYNLGSDEYFEVVFSLKHENEVLRHTAIDMLDWLKSCRKMIEDHQYFTLGAQTLFNEKKMENQEQIKQMIKTEKKDKKGNKEKKIGLDATRVGQMMLKTSLRNHVDLSSLADGKANTMLSVNALILTIAMPLMASNIQDNTLLLVPTGILLLTCVLSMIYATLATRPSTMKGIVEDEDIRKGRADMFFFGNFFNLSFPQFKQKMDTVINNAADLENSVYLDLFNSGKALGGKYKKLRVCYTIFIVGITLTAVAFMVSFLVVFKTH